MLDHNSLVEIIMILPRCSGMLDYYESDKLVN
jgi:hypothetical protein